MIGEAEYVPINARDPPQQTKAMNAVVDQRGLRWG
jgi:hypothetical protein